MTVAVEPPTIDLYGTENMGELITTFTYEKNPDGISINVVGCMELFDLAQKIEFVRGVICMHSDIVPVIDMQIRSSPSPTEITGEVCILLLSYYVKGKDQKLGLIVDNITDVLEIASRAMDKEVDSDQNNNLTNVLAEVEKIAQGINFEDFSSLLALT